MTIDEAFDPELLVQADAITRATPRAKGALGIEQTTVPVSVSGWSTLGPLPPEVLAGVVPVTVRYTEHRDGARTDLSVDGGDRTASAALDATIGTGQLRPARPERPVAPGGAWQDVRTVELPLRTADAEIALTLDVRATHVFHGWATVEGRRAALVASEVRIDGSGIGRAGDHVAAVRLSARTAAWTWTDPTDGTLVYLLSVGEITVSAGDHDDRPTRVSMRMAAGPPP